MPASLTRYLRPTVLVSILVAAAVFIARIMLDEGGEIAGKTGATPVEAPQFFLDQAFTTRYRQDGNIDYQFNSDHIDYFRSADTAVGTANYFIFYTADNHSWHARSDVAHFINGNRDITLSGQVRIWEPDRHLELTTDTIRFDESKQTAETAEPVTVNSTFGETHAIGLKADFNREKLQLLSAVTGTYHVAH